MWRGTAISAPIFERSLRHTTPLNPFIIVPGGLPYHYTREHTEAQNYYSLLEITEFMRGRIPSSQRISILYIQF